MSVVALKLDTAKIVSASHGLKLFTGVEQDRLLGETIEYYYKLADTKDKIKNYVRSCILLGLLNTAIDKAELTRSLLIRNDISTNKEEHVAVEIRRLAQFLGLRPLTTKEILAFIVPFERTVKNQLKLTLDQVAQIFDPNSEFNERLSKWRFFSMCENMDPKVINQALDEEPLKPQ